MRYMPAARRPNTKFLIELLPGETAIFLETGGMAIIHPERPAVRVDEDGKRVPIDVVEETSKRIWLDDDDFAQRYARALVQREEK